MTRFKRIVEDPATGWSALILPVMKGYKMACCDCGLVHDMNFAVFAIVDQDASGKFTTRALTDDEVQVGFTARRNNRATAAKRRKSA